MPALGQRARRRTVGLSVRPSMRTSTRRWLTQQVAPARAPLCGGRPAHPSPSRSAGSRRGRRSTPATGPRFRTAKRKQAQANKHVDFCRSSAASVSTAFAQTLAPPRMRVKCQRSQERSWLPEFKFHSSLVLQGLLLALPVLSAGTGPGLREHIRQPCTARVDRHLVPRLFIDEARVEEQLALGVQRLPLVSPCAVGES